MKRSQEEIWLEHTKNIGVDNIIYEYKNPSPFQIQFIEYIETNECNLNKKIIEIGCETGVASLILSDKFQKTLLDLNPMAIELCKRAFSELRKKADFIVADMFDMPIDNGSFDVIFNAGVIEHFSFNERIGILKEYSRILKSGGNMYIAFPNHFSLPYRVSYLIYNLFLKWPYPMEYKILNLKKEISMVDGLQFEERIVLSKETLFSWLSFSKLFKNMFVFLDKFLNFEGYLTVVKIAKK